MGTRSIKIQGLNPNEIYCCDKRDVVQYFVEEEQEDLFIVFGGGVMSRKESKNNEYYYKQYNVKGRVVFWLSVDNINSSLKKFVFLHAYILNRDEESEEIRTRFSNEVLPKLYSIYQNVKASAPLKTDYGRFNAIVSYHEKKFAIKEIFK